VHEHILLAENVDAQLLLNFCLNFAADHFSELSKTQDWNKSVGRMTAKSVHEIMSLRTGLGCQFYERGIVYCHN